MSFFESKKIENFMEDFEDIFLDLFKDMGDLLLEELSEKFGISFIDNYSTERGFYSEMPSNNMEIEIPFLTSNGFAGFGEIEELPEKNYDKYNILIEEEEDNEDEEKEEETKQQFPVQTNSSPYYGNIVIKKVPKYVLGYHVLGRAFPYLGLIEIAADLYGQEFEEVKTHEILHIKHPQASEMEIRRMVKEILPFSARFH